MRIAVIDIGTNSTRLLVTETMGDRPETGSKLPVLSRRLITTRLGQGMASGVLADRAMERTVAALQQFKAEIDRLKADCVKAVATSAVRDAANRGVFLRRVKEETGLDIEVLSGPAEARMSYLGVVRGLDSLPLGQTLVVDIGGGSTEFIWSKAKGEISYRSVKAGAVRMTEGRHGMRGIREVLQPVLTKITAANPRHLVGVGGTVTTLAAIAQGLKVYDAEKVHGYYLEREKVKGILADLTDKPPEERRRVAGLQPERANIIVAGIQIAAVILEELRLPGITASETDIMYGATYDLLEKINGRS